MNLKILKFKKINKKDVFVLDEMYRDLNLCSALRLNAVFS